MASYTPNYNLYKPAGADQFDNFLTEFGNNMDIIDQNLGGGGGSSSLGGLSDVNLTSPITADALIYDGAEWVNSPLSAVAFSGDYTDLLNAPAIPTKTSDLNNDSDFVSDSAYVHTDNNFTNADVTKLSGIQAGAEVNVQSDWNEADNTADDYIKNKPTIPTKTSDLTNDSGFITSASVPTKTSDLTNDSGFLDSSDITVTQVQTTGTKIATIDVDGNSTDLYAPNGGGSGGHTILNESGTALADEPNLQFTDGLKATDDSVNSKTQVGVDTTFTEASIRSNIFSGDSLSTILGKIRKWFTDIPNTFLKLAGGTLTGSLYTNATNELQIVVKRDHSNTVSQPATIYVGNNTPDGTAGSTYGVLRLMGKGAYGTDIYAPDASGYHVRSIKLPDKDGTVALTSDLPTYAGNQVQLKATSIRLNVGSYGDYGGSKVSGFGGEYINIPLSRLKTAGLLTDFTCILNANIFWFSSNWRSYYPDGRIILDSFGMNVCILLGKNYINDGVSVQLELMCIGY